MMIDLLIIALLALGMLAAAIPAVDPTRLHLSALGTSFNDQARYITMGRSLADTGRIRPHELLTSALWRQLDIQNHIMYHPGHQAVLAAAYRLLGYGIWQTYLTGVLGFVISALLTYAIARRLGGRGAGLFAAILWIGFPTHLLLAWSAMMEMAVTAASVLALWGFLKTSERLRPYVGPPLLLLPFLVRDTCSLLIVPMLAVLVYGEQGQRMRHAAGVRPLWGRGVLLFAGAVALCTAVELSPLCRPRVGTHPGLLLDGSVVVLFQDAERQQALSSAPPSAYLDALGEIAHRNFYQVTARLDGSDPSLMKDVSAREVREISLYLMLASLCMLLSLYRGVPLGMGISITVLIILAGLTVTYQYFHLSGLRMVLFTMPAICAALAVALAPLLRRLSGKLILGSLGLALLLLSQWHIRVACADRHATDEIDDQATAFLESLGHDDRTLLAAPYRLFMDYEVRHYPVDVAFLPANRTTLSLMVQRNRLGTVVLPETPQPGETLTAAQLQEVGLTLVGRRTFRRTNYLVFQRR